MSDFNLNCEHFLATTRQHFFAGELASAGQQGVPKDDSEGSDTEHRAHAGR